jgi:hypothetical protein
MPGLAAAQSELERLCGALGEICERECLCELILVGGITSAVCSVITLAPMNKFPFRGARHANPKGLGSPQMPQACTHPKSEAQLTRASLMHWPRQRRRDRWYVA